jgi:hypothetical protein
MPLRLSGDADKQIRAIRESQSYGDLVGDEGIESMAGKRRHWGTKQRPRGEGCASASPLTSARRWR